MENGKIEMKRKLNLLFITQEDPFYVRILFEEFLKEYPDVNEIKGVVISSTFGKKSFWHLVLRMYNFYGTIGFIRMGFRFTKIKILEIISKFIITKKNYSLEQLFSHYNISVVKRDDINAKEFIDQWKKENIDVIVSVAASKIFKKDLLELPKWGCINIHHAKLPYYRGMMPNFWQMYHGEKKVGISVHKMNSKIDAGEIIVQREIMIEENESLDSLIRRTKKIGAHFIIEVLNSIRENSITFLPNSSEKGAYFTFPTKKQVREFKRRGKRLL